MIVFNPFSIYTVRLHSTDIACFIVLCSSIRF